MISGKPARMPFRRLLLAYPLLLIVLMLNPSSAEAQPSPLDELMRRMAAVAERRATFTEEKTVTALSQPVRTNGRLVYRRPSYLEKVTYPPHAESIVVKDGRLSVTLGDEPPRSVDLADYPEVGALVE